MKRTKNMMYNETIKSEELYLYSINDWFCYEKIIMPTVQNLIRKAQRGIYDREKAIDAFYHVATSCARRYNNEYCGRFDTCFKVTDRFTCAVDMEKRYREYIGLE